MEKISSFTSVDVVGITTVLPKQFSLFHEIDIDMVFLDCSYDIEESIAFGKMIKNEGKSNIKVVYLFGPIDEIIIQHLVSDKIRYFLCQPFGVQSIIRMISDEVGSANSIEKIKLTSIESYMVQVMKGLGLPVHLQGYTFLKSASTLVLASPTQLHMPMKSLYKEVARMHSTTITRVEKSMRTAIKFAYRVEPQKIAFQGKKPTNSQVIHYISEQVHLLDINQKEGVSG